MPFCKNCGKELASDAKFCTNCGCPVDAEIDTKQSQRKQKFEGEIRKCPNCGEPLKSFMTSCPICGHEIRHIEASSAVKELALRLQQIEARKMPSEPLEPIRVETEKPPSFMKKAIGWDFNEDRRRSEEREKREEAREARLAEIKRKEEKFEKEKANEKANLIRNFPIPNTKEDILEFMLLVSTNINLKRGANRTLLKAWIAKMDQVYKKAEISFNNHSDFEQVQEIYGSIKKRIKNVKIRKALLVVCPILLVVILYGLYWNKTATISIIVVIFISFIIVTIANIRRKLRQTNKTKISGGK